MLTIIFIVFACKCFKKMSRHLIAIVIFMSLSSALAQSLEEFKTDFRKALSKNFSEKELNEVFRRHSSLLTPHSDVTQLAASLKGQHIDSYPLAEFKNDKLYIENIYKLINSKKRNQRILSYLIIAGTGDVSFESTLLKKIREEKDKGCLIWAGLALLHLKTAHTTPLFDFLVENETFGDAHMLPLFVQLNEDSLQLTAYRRINSDKPMAKILAAHILSKTPRNPQTEDLLKRAVTEWDMNIKGYAIYSIKELQIGDLLETMRPILDSTKTRRIALEALANSPTDADRNYLFDAISKMDTVSEEMLNCFYTSKNIQNLRYWLKLLRSRPGPKNYFFFVFQQPLIRSNDILPELQVALHQIDNPKILGELARAMEGRADDKSTDIMITLLSHENESVRYWTAEALRGNRSSKLICKLPELIRNPSTNVTPLAKLAIENNLDTLQSIYENIYKTALGQDWQRASLEYLATFPKSECKEIFRNVLIDKNSDFSEKRSAALGLGRLKDESSVDLIISACRHESEGSDYNAQAYLSALGMIKCEKAKMEIEKYKNSSEQLVRKMVLSILENW